MHVDSQKLEQLIKSFVTTPAAEAMFADETKSLILALIEGLVFFIGGLFLCVSRKDVPGGLRLVVAGLTLQSWRTQNGPRFRKKRDKLRGLIGHAVIIGPELRKISGTGVRLGLVLGSFDDVPADVLSKKRAEFGGIYAGRCPRRTAANYDINQEMFWKMLRDDKYQENRRRRVPEAFSDGRELWLFDTTLYDNRSCPNDRTLVACLAFPGTSGGILQIPWDTIEDAVTLNAKEPELPTPTHAEQKSSHSEADDLPVLPVADENEEDDTNPSRVSIAMLAVSHGARLSWSAIESDLQANWPVGFAFSNVDEKEDMLSVQLGETSVVLAMMPAPIPWTDLTGPCQTSWLWPDAESKLKQHDEHIIVTVIGDCSPIERAKLLTQVMAALIATCRTPVGVYWSSAPLVMSPEMFRDFAVKILPDGLPANAWVDFRVGREPSGKSAGFTSGMSALGYMDFETQSATEPPGELRDRLFGLVNYILENGPVIRDGDTVGEDADERIKVVYSKSAFGNSNRVMRLDYSATR